MSSRCLSECQIHNTPTRKRSRIPVPSSCSPKTKQKPQNNEYRPVHLNVKWTAEEKEELLSYCKRNENENIDWEGCARLLNIKYNGNRSALEKCEDEVESPLATSNSSDGDSLLRNILINDSFNPLLTSTPSSKDKFPIVSNDAISSEIKNIKSSSDHGYSKSADSIIKSSKKKHIGAFKRRLATHSNTVSKLEDISVVKPAILSLKDCVRLKLQLSKSRNIQHITDVCLSISPLRQSLLDNICESVGKRLDTMRNRKHGSVSLLMAKEFSDLEQVKFGDIIDEVKQHFPDLLQLLLALMLPKNKIDCPESMANLIPKLTMIYSIIMQNRYHELSRMQRVVAMCLADNISDQAVFDRLNRVGVSSSYCVTLKLFDDIGKMYPLTLIEALKEGKYIRFVGDNLDFSVGTHNETFDRHKHMVDMFLSTALISDHHFLTKPEQPQIQFEELTTEQLLLSRNEYAVIRENVVKLLLEIVSEKLPQLQYLSDALGNLRTDRVVTKTEVVPLPCLPFNEQKYQDDVEILQWYQNLCERIINESGIDPTTKFQIGGDQLTRERFTGAFLLRLENVNAADRFSHLGACTFEFFHLGMNYLEKVIFGELWNEKGVVEQGTLRGESERISRKSVDPNVMKAYDADKRFVLEYLDAVTVEAAMDYFGMESRNGTPTNNVPPKFETREEKQSWVKEHFGEIVDNYIYPGWSNSNQQPTVEDGDGFVEVCLSNGMLIKLPICSTTRVSSQQHFDKVKDYAHLSLEVGFTFKYFLELVKCPDREKFLGLLKMMMLPLKAHSINAKYLKEILRMLIQQYSVFGLKEACQIFYTCFVNLRGKKDAHVPADQVQEVNVKVSKAYIKHMFSNKTEGNIINRTSALPGIHSIASNFDHQAGTIIRAKRHDSKQIDNRDENILLDDMRYIKPFVHTSGRMYDEFGSVP